MCEGARQRRAQCFCAQLRAVVSAASPLGDFPLLGSGFGKELRLTEEIHWPVHMRKSQCVCLSSGLENVNISAPTGETLRISCCWNTRSHNPYCTRLGKRSFSIRATWPHNTECLFSQKALAEGASDATWKPPDAAVWARAPSIRGRFLHQRESNIAPCGTGGVSSLKCLISALLKQGNTQDGA